MPDWWKAETEISTWWRWENWADTSNLTILIPLTLQAVAQFLFLASKKLTKLLASDDDEVVAIACFDIGEFALNYPNGRAIASRLGAKNTILRLIEHDHPEIQHNAIVCVSKLLVNNWQVSFQVGDKQGNTLSPMLV